MPIETVHVAVCSRCAVRAPIDLGRAALPDGWRCAFGDQAQHLRALILCGSCGDQFAAFMAAGTRPTGSEGR